MEWFYSNLYKSNNRFLIFTVLEVLFICAGCNQVDVPLPVVSSQREGAKELPNNANPDDILLVTQHPQHLRRNSPVHLEYTCSEKSIIHVTVQVWTEVQDDVTIFRHRVTCSPDVGQGLSRTFSGLDTGQVGYGDALERKQAVVRLVLPRYLAYRPSRTNKYSVYVDKALLLVWMTRVSTTPQDIHNSVSPVEKHVIPVSPIPPFSRDRRPVTACQNWWGSLQEEVPYSPMSPVEEEVFHAITYPLALFEHKSGMYRVMPAFKNKTLKAMQEKNLVNPSFTVSLWIYLTNHCTQKLCSVMQHVTWDEQYATPLIFLNGLGQIHVEVILENGLTRAYLTPESNSVPLHTWTRIVISCYKRQLNVTVRWGDTVQQSWLYKIVLREEDEQYFDDRVGLFLFGGWELHPSFQGFLGPTSIYRRHVIDPAKIPMPSATHPMFTLGLDERPAVCKNLKSFADRIVFHVRELMAVYRAKTTCRNRNDDIFLQHLPENKLKQCSQHRKLFSLHSDRPETSFMREIYPIIRRWVLNGKPVLFIDIGAILLRNATSLLERSAFQVMDRIISMLEAASCMDTHNATFILSVIYNYGLGIKSDDVKAQNYLMHGAASGNRLCLMALGNKHAFGLDGVPLDMEQSYAYYKAVADLTKLDREAHSADGVYTELVRLTNEAALSEMTEETGDLFLYIKHQANQGVFHAQQNMARMLYWGAQGVQRDVEAALEYYRLAAATGNPEALYDYGIVLIKGHGTAQNISLGVEQMEKAAKQNHPQAMNALGWYSLEIAKNYTAAAEYFEAANSFGNKDAAHNLAVMYLKGLYPGYGMDRVKAWPHISDGAKRGQLECSILVALYNMRGHPSIVRNPNLAVIWARLVAEQNPSIGQILANGVRTYRQQNWMASLFYYLLAASTGVEVGNFNLAYLLDEYQIPSILEKECKWRHYNLSILRPQHEVDTYALNKMADYHYGSRDMQAAVDLYSRAVLRGDPQGLYNLACLVEEGVHVDPAIWHKVNVPPALMSNNVSLITHLYSRCLNSPREEAFLPCTLALYRIYILYILSQYKLLLYMSLTTGATILLTMLIYKVRHKPTESQATSETSADSQSEPAEQQSEVHADPDLPSAPDSHTSLESQSAPAPGSSEFRTPQDSQESAHE